MTVCIAAICCEDDDPKAIVASDRMVTQAMGSPIEYEHTSTKMSQLTDWCIMMSAGSVPLIEELTYRTKLGITNHSAEHDSIQLRDVSVISMSAYQNLIQDFVERQVLSTYDITLDQFREQERFNQAFLSGLDNAIREVRGEIESRLGSLIVGVDQSGANIFGIHAGNTYSFNMIGFQAIGSGEASAQSVFVHNKYDKKWDLKQAILTVVEAKTQAEEAQGVGRETDIAIITEDGTTHLKKEKVNKLVQIIGTIREENQAVREKILKGNDVGLDMG
jgi:hypothetical protein